MSSMRSIFWSILTGIAADHKLFKFVFSTLTTISEYSKISEYNKTRQFNQIDIQCTCKWVYFVSLPGRHDVRVGRRLPGRQLLPDRQHFRCGHIENESHGRQSQDRALCRAFYLLTVFVLLYLLVLR